MVEQAGRVAADRGVYRVVGFAKFLRRLGLYVAALGFFIGGAVCARRHGDVLGAAAVSVIVGAVFLSAFEVVHNINLLVGV